MADDAPAAPPVQRIFSQVPVKAPAPPRQPGAEGIKAEEYFTVDQLVDLLRTIHREALRSGLADRAAFKGTADQYDEAVEEAHGKLWKKYKMFADELPLVFRWASSNFKMSEKAFRHYMKHNHRAMWDNPKHKLREQSEYIVHAWKEENPDAGPDRVREFRASVVKNVIDEQERYEKAAKEAQELCKKNKEDRRARLKQSIREIAAGMRGDGK